MYRVNEFLTPEERLQAIRMGAMRKLASMGMTPSDFSGELEKQAQESGSDPLASLGGLIRLALAIGIPVGALSYAMKSAVMPARNQNKRLKAQLTEYNDIVDRYKQELGVDDGEGGKEAVL